MATQPLQFDVHDDPALAALAAVDAGLDLSNRLTAALDQVRPLASFARSASGAVVGGAVGRTWGECCELQQLWVEPTYRKRGVATHLMGLFEARATSRRCRFFYLETFSFQAPAFYRRLGYSDALQLDGFSAQISKFIMIKRLARGVMDGL